MKNFSWASSLVHLHKLRSYLHEHIIHWMSVLLCPPTRKGGDILFWCGRGGAWGVMREAWGVRREAWGVHNLHFRSLTWECFEISTSNLARSLVLVKGRMVLKMSTRGRQIGAQGGAPPKRFPLSNLWMLPYINFKLGMLIGLDERMDGIEDEHQGASYGSARRRASEMLS